MPSCDKRQKICLQKLSSLFQFTRFEFQPPQTLSSRILFPCIFVFLYQNQEKISFLTPLNLGKAQAVKKAIIACPEPVSQFLVLWKSLESSFGTNSRFGHWLKKYAGHSLGILDDCKCSENFLAPTIPTPILLSATFSIQIVDGLRLSGFNLLLENGFFYGMIQHCETAMKF